MPPVRAAVRKGLAMRESGRRWAAAAFGVAGVLLGGAVQAQCRLALVLAFDVSASVDQREYHLQMRGTAAALTSGAVRDALLLGGDPVALGAFLWSGTTEMWRVADWTLIDSDAALEAFAGEIATARRVSFFGRTATGVAMETGLRFLAQAPLCDAQTIDIATDGEANAGVEPATVVAPNVTINALSVGGDLPLDHGDGVVRTGPLSRYLERNVIRGRNAFVEKAEGYEDFGAAMRRKLLREMGEVNSSALEGEGGKG